MLMNGWFAQVCERGRQRRLRRPRHVWHRRLPGLAAECLESRALLSNIAVTAHAGVVTLKGDTADHTVNATVVNGDLHLVGTNGTEFTFNGKTAATIDVPLNSTIRAINIVMPGAGNNDITFDATGLPKVSGKVDVDFGSGADALTFENATVKGAINVHAGNGADKITLSNDTAGGIFVQTGNGADTIALSNDTSGSVSIHAGNGGDTVTLSNVTLGTAKHEDDSEDDDSGDDDSKGDRHSAARGPKNDTRRSRGDDARHEKSDDEGENGQPLVIMTGSGDDTITLNSVVSTGTAFGGKWQIAAGAGNNNVTLTNVNDHGFLNVSATGSGNDTVTITGSTFGKQVNVSLPNGTEQIIVSGDTFNGKTTLSTGRGANSTISVDDSQFRTVAVFAMAGANAQLNLESTDTAAGSGTVFNGPVFASLTGASAVANLGVNTVGDTLTFNKVVHITGGSPIATVNVMTANVTFAHKLLLKNATEVDV